MSKSSVSEKEIRLIQKIEKAQAELTKLQEKQKLEIGALAYKHGLNHYDTPTLEKAFSELSKELSQNYAS